MSRIPRFGPKPGEWVRWVRLTEINVYRLPAGLKVGEVVRIVSWDINYIVEKDGHHYTISQINIVTPHSDIWGNLVCPDCAKNDVSPRRVLELSGLSVSLPGVGAGEYGVRCRGLRTTYPFVSRLSISNLRKRQPLELLALLVRFRSCLGNVQLNQRVT